VRFKEAVKVSTLTAPCGIFSIQAIYANTGGFTIATKRVTDSIQVIAGSITTLNKNLLK